MVSDDDGITSCNSFNPTSEEGLFYASVSLGWVVVGPEAHEMLRVPWRERERDGKVQVSTVLATILVIRCRSCSIVKLIEVYITELAVSTVLMSSVQ